MQEEMKRDKKEWERGGRRRRERKEKARSSITLWLKETPHHQGHICCWERKNIEEQRRKNKERWERISEILIHLEKYKWVEGGGLLSHIGHSPLYSVKMSWIHGETEYLSHIYIRLYSSQPVFYHLKWAHSEELCLGTPTSSLYVFPASLL